MVFHSHAFILLFLPLSVIAYFLAAKRSARAGILTLLAASVLFYALYSPAGAALVCADLAVHYGLYRWMRSRPADARRPVRTLSIVLSIVFLFVFKYASSAVAFFSGLAGSGFVLRSILVPAGISFLTFSKISFMIDESSDDAPLRSADEFFLYMLYFPKVLSGPIVRPEELLAQFRQPERASVNWAHICEGLYSFSIGLAKKVLIADFLGILVDACYAKPAACSGVEALAAIFGFSLQLYFDFSGYSDMAVGVARMMNIDLPQNFNSPYKALDITDFWRRWHITLTGFLTRYLYYPLGGNRKGKARQYLNILIVFAVSGIWHGVGLTFLVWGLLHGLMSVLTRMIRPRLKRQLRVPSVAVTFLLVTFAWVFFRAQSLPDAVTMLLRPFSGLGNFNDDLVESLLQPTLFNVLTQALPFKAALALVFAALGAVVFFTKNTAERTAAFRPTFRTALVTFLLLVVSLLSFTAVTSFIYGGF